MIGLYAVVGFNSFCVLMMLDFVVVILQIVDVEILLLVVVVTKHLIDFFVVFAG
jgi:hypothetical protein